MGEFFNYDDRVFDIIDKNKELMRMKDVINNILKSPEIKKILEKASKGGFGLDEDDKDFSKMIVDNNYEINTILDAYMQEISVRERPPLPRDLVLDSARSSIDEKELGLLKGVSDVTEEQVVSSAATMESAASRSVTLDSLDLYSEKEAKRDRTSEFIGEGEGDTESHPSERAVQRGTEIVRESVTRAETAALERANREEERAKARAKIAQDLLPGAAQASTEEEEAKTGQALLEQGQEQTALAAAEAPAQDLLPKEEKENPSKEVAEGKAGTSSATTTGTGGDYGGITKPYRRRGEEGEEPGQPSVDEIPPANKAKSEG